MKELSEVYSELNLPLPPKLITRSSKLSAYIIFTGAEDS
jgi:hypothetical protein